MTTPATASGDATTVPRRLPFYYGWVVVGVAALAMSATLPGRSHGLGLITEPLIADLQIPHTTFARINFATCLLGAAFCVPIGWLLDRCGARVVLGAVMTGLGLAVIVMSRANSALGLFLTLLVVRGLGQSSLSVVSMAAVGKWFRGRLGQAMGVYSVLLTFGFIAGVLGMGAAVKHYGWRSAWDGLGWLLLAGAAPFCWLLHRNAPQQTGDVLDPPAATSDRPSSPDIEFTFSQALRTPAFWVFAGGTGCFNLIWTALTLFNERILLEGGFTHDDSVIVMALLTAAGLVANLAGGALVRRDRLPLLLGVGLTGLAVALWLAPSIVTLSGLFLYAGGMGLAGGLMVVIFFAAFGHIYGRLHLGRIQGAAQLISVIASAVGPVVSAEGREYFGAYGPVFYGLSAASGLFALAAFGVPLPEKESLPATPEMSAPREA